MLVHIQVMTVDIQTGDRQVQERHTSRDIEPPTPPRSQSTLPLRRSLQKKLAARAAASVIAEGAALGAPEGSERPYFKVFTFNPGAVGHLMSSSDVVNSATPTWSPYGLQGISWDSQTRCCATP